MCSLRFFQANQPKHLCTMPQMSTNTISYFELFHQPHVCTQAHKFIPKSHVFVVLSLTTLVQPQILTPRWPWPSSVWWPPKFGFLDLVFSAWFLVLPFPMLSWVRNSQIHSSVHRALIPSQTGCIEVAAGRVPFIIHPGDMKVLRFSSSPWP